MDIRFLELLDELESAVALDQLRAIADRLVSYFDLSGFSYHVYGPTIGFHRIEDWPTEWSDHYHKQRYGDVDPVVRKVLQEIQPFSWSDIFADHSPSPIEARILGEGREYGLKEGGEVPLHGPNAVMATFSVYSNDSGAHFHDVWKSRKNDIRLFAHYFHYAFLDKQLKAPAPDGASLSARERECLVWRARDKTVWETSRILGISEHTVKTHLVSAARKLQVASVQQAVVISLLTRAIVPY